MKKICFVSARPGSAWTFLRYHIWKLSEHYEVHLAANFDEYKLEADRDFGNVICHNVHIRRNISIFNDLKALSELINLIKSEKFDSVHSLTPKAGLLTMTASWLNRTNVRIHIFTGQVWAAKSGVGRMFLKLMDRMTSTFATHILVDGEGQRRYIVKEGVVSDTKSRVLANGSIAGVQLDRFVPSDATRSSSRQMFGYCDEDVVFVFMGRLTRDKGINELFAAFNRLAGEASNAKLLLFGQDVGDYEFTEILYPNIIKDRNYYYNGLTSSPQSDLQAGDVFVLPTYREGFGMSVIEASCLGLPVICSDAYGVMDAMVENETGLRCKVGDIDSLYVCMKNLYNDKSLRERLGRNGRQRVVEKFSGETVTKAWIEFYDEILGH